MYRYALRRLALLVPILLGVATITFLLMYVVPGDPVRAIAGERYDEATIAAMRGELGLDRPLLVQYADFLGRVARFDLGRSFVTRRPVADAIRERFPRTALLAGSAMLIAVIGGVAIGVLAAWGRVPAISRTLMTVSLVGVSMPVFWLGLLLIYVFAIELRILPPSGYGGGSPAHLVLPALTLGLGGAAYYARITRTAMLDELGLDYVRTARAKGIAERRIAWHHALRNAMPPVLVQVGLDLGFFLGGVVVVESVFSWPGIGKLAVDAVTAEDLPMLMGTVLFGTLCIVVANLLVDLLIALVDPRVQLRS